MHRCFQEAIVTDYLRAFRVARGVSPVEGGFHELVANVWQLHVVDGFGPSARLMLDRAKRIANVDVMVRNRWRA
ncbi:MAG: hypothetical protein LZF86_50006 [Nitrospira sp.]|nr:MAG: hypothetical protein LZF86_50006 [Nitrospira sp.]